LFVFNGSQEGSAVLLTAKRKVTKEKLSAAPASFNVCALTSGVVAEPDDAEFCG